jgi:sortase A
MSVVPIKRQGAWQPVAALVLIGSGLAILGYCAFIRADSWIFQRREGRELTHSAQTTSPTGRAAPAPSGIVGRITIARLGLAAVITEGAGETVLRRAVGHVPGTALPGQPGNVGLAGHRDTFFQPLKDVRLNDIIVLATDGGEFCYRVVSTKIVDPRSVEVLDPTVGETLTLVTCYPFRYIGAAPNRFIVRAERIRLHS